MYRERRNVWYTDLSGLKNIGSLTDALVDAKRKDLGDTFLVEVRGVGEPAGYKKAVHRMRQLLDAKGRKHSMSFGVFPPTNQEILYAREKGLDGVLKEYITESAMIDAVKDAVERLVSGKTFQTESIEGNYRVNLTAWVCRYLGLASENTGDKPYLAMFWGELNLKEREFLSVLSEIPCVDIVYFATVGESLKGISGMGSLWVIEDGAICETLREIPESEGIEKGETAAYKAERELDTLLYTPGGGVYRPNQYRKIQPLLLQTTYDEIGLLWGQAAKYRPSFEVVGDTVRVGTLFAKVEGVDRRGREEYIRDARGLMENPHTVVVCSGETLLSEMQDVNDRGLRQFVYNGGIDFEGLKESEYYQYGIYSNETQERIFCKVREMLDMDLEGFPKGAIYKLLGVACNLSETVMRLLHSFDYTGTIPKVVLYRTKDETLSQEESLSLMLLSRLGFDVLVFVPTGYRVMESYIDERFFTRHIIGEFVYDMPERIEKAEEKQDVAAKLSGFIERLKKAVRNC